MALESLLARLKAGGTPGTPGNRPSVPPLPESNQLISLGERPSGTPGTPKNDKGGGDGVSDEPAAATPGDDAKEGAAAGTNVFLGVPVFQVFQREENTAVSKSYHASPVEHLPSAEVFQVFQSDGVADEGRYADRAAALEHDDALPRAEAERLAAAEQGFASPEALFNAVALRWDHDLRRIGGTEGDPRGRRCIEAALAFVADGWAATALRCGWSELELVGACPRAPWERLDRMGAAYSTFTVLAVTAEEILYHSSGKTPLRRLRGSQADGSWLPWERFGRVWAVPRCVLTEAEMVQWLPPKRPGDTAVGWEMRAHDLLRAWRVPWFTAQRLVKDQSAAHDWRPGRGAP